MAAGSNGCHDAWLAESVWPILGKRDCATDCSAHNRGILTTLSKTYRAEGATVMSVCIFGESALEFMRSSGRLAPEFLDRPRTQKLDGCGISPKAMFADDMERLGVKTRPVHILVSKESGARSRDDIVCHRSAAELPPRSLIYVNRDVLVTSPALTFLHLATVDLHKKRQRTVEELAMIGLELCGTYLLDDSWDGLTNTAKPLTSVEQITRVLDAMPGAPGVVRAREALVLVGDGSNSPMESVLCALLTWPRRLGGYALGPVSLNHRVSTADGDRYVDVAFPGHKVGLEYKGRKFHAIEQAGRLRLDHIERVVRGHCRRASVQPTRRGRCTCDGHSAENPQWQFRCSSQCTAHAAHPRIQTVRCGVGTVAGQNTRTPPIASS